MSAERTCSLVQADVATDADSSSIRCRIPGPPLTQRNSVAVLHEAGVLIALGVS